MPIKSIQIFAAILLIIMSGICCADNKIVNIGVLSVWGNKNTVKRWQPTLQHLNKNIPGHEFRIIPLKLKDTESFTANKSIDFILTNPGNYIALEAKYGVSRLATLKTVKQQYVMNRFGAVIFTRNNRSDINSIKDLRRKTFMGVKEQAFGGFQMAWLEFKKVGIDPFKDFSRLSFSGLPQDKIVYAVLNNDVDAGTVRTATFERMVSEGLINIGDFKILDAKSGDNFPFIRSTPLYPEWPFAKLIHTSEKLAEDVSITLLKMPGAKTTGIAGWTVPLDYNPVRNLFQELNLPPYRTVEKNFFKEYWVYLLFFLLLFTQPFLLYIRKLRVSLRAGKEKIAQSETEWENALDFLDEPWYMVDLEDRVIRANKAFYKKVKAGPERVIGQVVTDFTHPEGEKSPCRVCRARKELVDSVITLEADDPVNKAGHPIEISVKVVRDKKNNPIGIIQRMQDLTQQREAEKAIRRNETLFKELLDSTPDPLIVTNADGTIILVNNQFEEQIGFNRDEVIGSKVEELIPEHIREKHVSLRLNYTYNPNHRSMSEVQNLYIERKNASIMPVEISLNPFTLDDEIMVITTIHDISKRIVKENELKRLASFPELNPIPILEFHKNGNITYANPASKEIFPNISDTGTNHEIFADLEAHYPELIERKELIRNVEINDSTFEQKIVYDPESHLFRMYIWDITHLRNLTRKMTYQATHDALTDLINRREFERLLDQAVTDTRVKEQEHSLCFMDLDQFKVVNDTCGHEAGDELLKLLAKEINTHVRESDSFARIGGDEFGLLLTGCPIDRAQLIAENIRKIVDKFRFSWDEKIFKVGISIGIVSINKDSGTTKEIQSAADTACYLAKDQGRNRIHIFRGNSSEIARKSNDTNWFNRINHAIDNNLFILYFQKIVAINDAAQEHYEVLVRMLNENNEIILPSSFIPSAERFGIMSSIDKWVLRQTLEVMNNSEYQHILFSVNLSGQSIGDEKFMTQCINLIHQSNINPSQLCFEITETAMIANIGDAIEFITTLRDLGCQVALDDFGSGLSSFGYLKNLPVDYLKIDGSLVKDIENDPVNVTMVESIIHIGHSMGLETIAEYVENDAIYDILLNLNIDYVQGYGVGRPHPIEKIIPENKKLAKP